MPVRLEGVDDTARECHAYIFRVGVVGVQCAGRGCVMHSAVLYPAAQGAGCISQCTSSAAVSCFVAMQCSDLSYSHDCCTDCCTCTLVLHLLCVVCPGFACPLPIVSATSSSKGPASSSRGGIGTLTGHVGDIGMAYIKLLPALAAAEGRSPPLQLQLEGQQVSVVPLRPKWWPSDWGREERAGSTSGAP